MQELNRIPALLQQIGFSLLIIGLCVWGLQKLAHWWPDGYNNRGILAGMLIGAAVLILAPPIGQLIWSALGG